MGDPPRAIGQIQPLRTALPRAQSLSSLTRINFEIRADLKEGYFGFCQISIGMRNRDARIRRGFRMSIWRQWQNGRTRSAQLRRLGVSHFQAAAAAESERWYWRMARDVAVQQALSNASLDSIGLPCLATSPNA
jgi:hypothetical protein